MWTFIKSATNKNNWLTSHENEICLIGRSNVGKSSLINALANNKKLAKISKTPGRTKLINYFQTSKGKIIVDLPGYGYAKVSKLIKKNLDQMIFQYLKYNQRIVLVCILIDSKIGFTKLDYEFINLIKKYQLNFVIILTKDDKINQSIRYHNHKVINENNWKYLSVSSLKNKNINLINNLIEKF